MKLYETVFISPPNLDDETLEGIIDEIKDFVSEVGGAVEKVEKWGKREMAYQIEKFDEGYYTLVQYRVPGEAIDKIRHKLKFREGILRYLIVKQEEAMEAEEVEPQSADEAGG